MKNYKFLLYFKSSLYCIFIFIITFLVFLIFFKIDCLSQSLAHFLRETLGKYYVNAAGNREIDLLIFCILVMSASIWIYLITLFIEYINDNKEILIYYIKGSDKYRRRYNRKYNEKDTELACLKEKNSLVNMGNIETLLERQNKINSKFSIKLSIFSGISGIILAKIVDKIF